VAVNCTAVPAVADGFAGVTAIDTSVAGVTVSVVELVTEPSVAEMLDDPGARLAARPLLEMVAAALFDDAQTTEAVMFLVVLSE
jgi:hypothetical protein